MPEPLLTAGLYTLIYGSKAHLIATRAPFGKPKGASLTSAWHPNIKVMAAVPQRSVGWALPFMMGSFYTNKLIKTLKSPTVKSLEEASDFLVKDGFRTQFIAKQWPVQSTEKRLHCWIKGDRRPARIAALFGDRDFTLAGSFDGDLVNVKNALTDPDIFDVDEANILKKHWVDRHALEQGLHWLDQKVATAVKQQPNKPVEVLVYLSGHGNAVRPEDKLKTPLVQSFPIIGSLSQLFPLKPIPQGTEALEWGMAAKIMKSEMQEKLNAIVNKYPPGKVKLILVNMSCHSGAWTA
jgi:hypothetical protein